MNRHGKYSVLIASLLISGTAQACPTCVKTTEFGTGVATDLAGSLEATSTTMSDVQQGFSDTSQALTDTSDEIVGAIMAASSSISTEIVLASEVQVRTLEAFKNKMEAVSQTRLIADHNLHVAETYGAVNVHSSECIPFSVYRDPALISEMMEANRARQLEDRSREFRSEMLDYSVVSVTTLGDTVYTEGDGELAMEQASLITGESAFPISPDIIMEISTRDAGEGGQASVQLLSAWLRSSTAGSDLASQIAKRVRPEAPEGAGTEAEKPAVAMMEELWGMTEKGMSTGGILEDSNASEAKLLRGIGRRGALSNKIRLEQLENLLAVNRASAAQVGYLSDHAMEKLDEAMVDAASRIQVERGSSEP